MRFAAALSSPSRPPARPPWHPARPTTCPPSFISRAAAMCRAIWLRLSGNVLFSPRQEHLRCALEGLDRAGAVRGAAPRAAQRRGAARRRRRARRLRWHGRVSGHGAAGTGRACVTRARGGPPQAGALPGVLPGGQVRAGRPLDGAAVAALLGRRMCAARALAARAAVARVAFGTTAAPGGRRVGRSAARRLHGVTLDAWHGSARDSEWCWQRGGCWPARQLVQPLTSSLSLLLSTSQWMVL